MNVRDYVIENWDNLPHSTFNDETVVIVKEITNSDEGYGHHCYEGYGVDKEGNLKWCYSSGCSCNGSCGADHQKTAKSFDVEWPDEFTAMKPEEMEFGPMEVTFSDY